MYTCAEGCKQFEKACKYIRHGQKIPNDQKKSNSLSASPKSPREKPLRSHVHAHTQHSDQHKDDCKNSRKGRHGCRHEANGLIMCRDTQSDEEDLKTAKFTSKRSSKAKNDELTYRMRSHNSQAS